MCPYSIADKNVCIRKNISQKKISRDLLPSGEALEKLRAKVRCMFLAGIGNKGALGESGHPAFKDAVRVRNGQVGIGTFSYKEIEDVSLLKSRGLLLHLKMRN